MEVNLKEASQFEIFEDDENIAEMRNSKSQHILSTNAKKKSTIAPIKMKNSSILQNNSLLKNGSSLLNSNI